MKSTIELKAQRYFQILSFLFLTSILGYFLLPYFKLTQDIGKHLPFVSNSVVKVTLAWLLCIYIAGDIRKRRGLILIFVLGHILSILSMTLYILYADTSIGFQFGANSMSQSGFLVTSIIVDVVVTLPALLFYFKIRDYKSYEHDLNLTVGYGFVKTLSIILAILFSLASIGYHIGPYIDSMKSFFIALPMVSNSAVKVAFMGMVCFYVFKNIHQNIACLNIVIVGHVVSIVFQVIYALSGKASAVLNLGSMQITEGQVLWGAVGLDTVITIVIIIAYLKYWKVKFNRPKFLRPVEYRSLVALSDVIVEGAGEEEPVDPVNIAANLDRYVSKMTARRKWVYRVMLYAMQSLPVLFGKAPFSELDYENKKLYLENRFQKKAYKKKKGLGFISNYMHAMIRVSQQLSFVGYYSDRKVQSQIGYEYFSQRERYKNLDIPERKPHPLKVLKPKDVKQDQFETDVCIVGSGAAGSILAYEMVKKGKNVLLVERGRYIEPRHFNEDEVDMIGKLYGDGVFQQTEDFKFTILQGSCVGGTTVVNNAVCFDPPEEKIKKWNEANGLDAQIDEVKLKESVQYIRNLIKIEPQVDPVELESLTIRKNEGFIVDLDGYPLNNKKLNPGDHLIEKGIRALDPGKSRFEYGSVDANINNCYGCGNCNIGCAFGKKLSMLDTVLPRAQRDFPGKLTIISECSVKRIITKTGKTKSAETVIAQLSDKRTINIKAKQVVLSAGTIASSYILKKSGISKKLPVGKAMCFNVGTPVYGVFDKEIRTYDGLQISHYYKPLEHPGVIYESWWNPPVSQAINMPGWFEDHYKNMRKYNNTMAIGVLMGSKSTGYINNALTGGPGVEYSPDRDEREKLAKGIKLAGEILLQAGAKKVMYNTWNYKEYTSIEQLDEIIHLTVNTDELALGTGHPQGGNAISNDPKLGVIGPDFKVHGYANLYVCDASVFPEALSVNPQLTVMAFAHYASSNIK